MRLQWFPICLAVALPAFADPGDDEAAIRQRFIDWTAAFNARDVAGACDLFAADLRYAIPDQIDGTQATMCGNLARVLTRDDLRLHYDEPAVHEILVSGDIAVVRLTWTLRTEAQGVAETSTEEGIDIFRRQPDGRWSIARFVAFAPSPNSLLQP